SQSRFDAQAPSVSRIIESLDFIHRQWARSHQDHLSAQHIEKLRKLVDAEFAQESAHASNPRIVADLEDRAVHFIEPLQLMLALLRIGNHRTKLQHRKRLPIEPTALL